MVLSKHQLRNEIALLAYLSIVSQRSLLVPNILVGVGKDVPGQLEGGSLGCREMPYQKSTYCKEIGDVQNSLVDMNPSKFVPYHRYVIFYLLN